jgi:capsular exopolysaccharide synthesis family protein
MRVSRIWDLLRKSESQIYDPEPPEVSEACQSPKLHELPVEIVRLDPGNRIAVHTDPQGPCADRFRFLRMRLRELWSTDKLKSLLITSPLPHDGKSTVALNLATSLADHGKRSVLLVEADLHQPTLARQLGLDFQSGFANCLEDGVDPFSVIRRIDPLGWYLLPAGRARSNPTELLQRETVSEIFQTASRNFDWVIVDSPPIAPLADAMALRQQTDATLLVARAGRTPVQGVEDALNLLGRKHVLGIVLNGVEGMEKAYSEYYASYGGSASAHKNGKPNL